MSHWIQIETIETCSIYRNNKNKLDGIFSVCSFWFLPQLDYIRDMLEKLPPALDSDSSGGEGEKKEVDEGDLAERAKLPQYVSRFEVSFAEPIEGGLIRITLATTRFTSGHCLEVKRRVAVTRQACPVCYANSSCVT